MIVQVAHGIVDALKTQPLTLALVVMNVGLMIIVWMEFDHIAQQHREVLALMTKCVDTEVLKTLGLLK